MMGALAWQATVIKKKFLCPGGGDRTGVHLFLAPGSPPPWCPCAPVLRVLPCCWSATRLVTRASVIAAPHQKHGATAKSLRGLQNFCIRILLLPIMSRAFEQGVVLCCCAGVDWSS